MLAEVAATIRAIKQVRSPRFLATERGYHGAFYCALSAALDRRGLLTQERILEMEYQKSSRHGTAQRPDIVFHIPAEVSNAGVRDNNFAVWALKHSANPEDASEDFGKLDEMCGVLEYPLCFFLNIASPETYLEIYRGQFSERLHSFAIPAVGGGDLRHSYFKNGTILNEIHRIP